jgi:hypothetical protein
MLTFLSTNVKLEQVFDICKSSGMTKFVSKKLKMVVFILNKSEIRHQIRSN